MTSATDGPRRGGIDLGGTKIQAIVADADNNVVGQARYPTPHEGGPQEVADAMAAALREAASEAGTETSGLLGVGIGSPGEIDAGSGSVSNAKNLPELDRELSARAEPRPGRWGRRSPSAMTSTSRPGRSSPSAPAASRDSILGVFWGTGVGGGLILGGKSWDGRGSAGEIGHMVVRRGGAICPCGNHGCVEAYAGRSAMEAEARKRVENGDKTDLFKLMDKHEKPRLTSGVWQRALEHDDEMAKDLIERAVKALGAGIASAVNLLDPEMVILGGGLGVRFGEQLGPRIEERMQLNLFDHEHPAFEVAALGDFGGALGAALLVSNSDRILRFASGPVGFRHRKSTELQIADQGGHRSAVHPPHLRPCEILGDWLKASE